jgi:hypothetical protein
MCEEVIYEDEHDETTITQNNNFNNLHHLCKEQNWVLIINEYRHLLYTKKERETEFFEIKLENNKICVSIPLQNSVFQYKTSFYDYYSMNTYLEQILH